MKVFTVCDGKIERGAVVDRFRLSSGAEIDAITIAEEGRGRDLGVLPVAIPIQRACPLAGQVIDACYCPECGAHCDNEPGMEPGMNRHRDETGPSYRPRVMAAEIGKTRAGRPKLVPPSSEDNDRCIVVFRTPIGFRGSNDHTGDRYEVPCPRRGQQMQYLTVCDDCGTRAPVEYGQPWTHPDEGETPRWHSFPGEIIVRGTIAQGDAGRMGRGEQLVAIMPKNTVFRTAYYGRRYGAPRAHYYVFDGDRIFAATWDERCIADLF